MRRFVLGWVCAVVWLLGLEPGRARPKSKRGGRLRDHERAARRYVQKIAWDDWSRLPAGEAAFAVPADAVGEGCTIERRALGNITEEEFEREYKFQKPLIISDATA